MFYVYLMTQDIYFVVITRQSNSPISKFSRLCNEFTSVWSMLPCNTPKFKSFLWYLWFCFCVGEILSTESLLVWAGDHMTISHTLAAYQTWVVCTSLATMHTMYMLWCQSKVIMSKFSVFQQNITSKYMWHLSRNNCLKWVVFVSNWDGYMQLYDGYSLVGQIEMDTCSYMMVMYW